MIVQNKIFLIEWDPWSGKSFMACAIMSNYRRIYSNLEVKKNGKSVMARTIRRMSDIEDIPYSDTKWIVVIEEGGVNANSKKFMSEQNIEFGQLVMLGRKKNVDICMIAQREYMVSKDFRELAKFIISMRSYFVAKDKLMFEFKIFSKGIYKKTGKIDLIEWSKKSGYTYDSLETSRIDT